jgi:alkylation response protein AidB-like acyl-CoA dehydrogenase
MEIMIAEREAARARRVFDLEVAERAIAHSDERGVPRAGRTAELAALRAVGARDLSLGRIYEGHLNGAQLVARCGTAEQRAQAARDIDAGHLFGVWNTGDDADPVRLEPWDAVLRLRGAKTWASGAGSITRPIVTAAWPDGGVQMCLVRMDDVAVRIDATGWEPLGMHASDSFRVAFDGVALEPCDLIGAPGEYERQPWFYGGALRFVAVQTGGIARLLAETVRYLRERGRDGDPFQAARVAEMRIAAHTALVWLDAGDAAWQRFDAAPSADACARVIDVVDMARSVTERAALDVIERAVRCVGARGLVAPEPIGGLVRDLHMYLRQPAPDAALLRIARTAFTEQAQD